MDMQNITPTPTVVEQGLATKLSPEHLAFYEECASMSGMTLEQWMAFEPF